MQTGDVNMCLAHNALPFRVNKFSISYILNLSNVAPWVGRSFCVTTLSPQSGS
jgi:hypothetical protein